MNLPVQVTFRDLSRSDALDSYVRTKAEKLPTFHRGISACKVALDAPHKHHQHGNHVHVRIDLTVAGAELVVDHDGGEAAIDAYAAVDAAFKTAERVLKTHSDKERTTTRRSDPVRGED